MDTDVYRNSKLNITDFKRHKFNKLKYQYDKYDLLKKMFAEMFIYNII